MEVYHNIQDIRTKLNSLRIKGNSMGLVPTMGSLHAGHIALVNDCRTQNDITIASVYINPTQFNKASDLQHYPRRLDSDLEVLETAGCDVAFVPSDEEMYPTPPNIKIDFGRFGEILEGKFRPGHFNGVGQVVSKLFNIINPDKAYFGQKDLQQLMIIRQLVKEFNFGIEIVGVKTVREKSGLAMSSRNQRLNSQQRKIASLIYKALNNGKSSILAGASIQESKEAIEQTYMAEPDIKTEYVEFVDMKKFVLLESLGSNIDNDIAICTAVHLGSVRLIDNIILSE